MLTIQMTRDEEIAELANGNLEAQRILAISTELEDIDLFTLSELDIVGGNICQFYDRCEDVEKLKKILSLFRNYGLSRNYIWRYIHDSQFILVV